MHKIIAANWKMFKTSKEAASMITELSTHLNGTIPENRTVIIFTPFTALEKSAEVAQKIPTLAIGAQNIYPEKEGAFTGEISAHMIQSTGASWVLTGHSERRHIMGESDTFVGQKTSFALATGLHVIVCVGETEEEREQGELYNVIARQLYAALAKIPAPINPEHIVIAYEPVWAIGTGKTANPEDIIEAHAIVREHLKSVLGTAAPIAKILYGGSVKPENATQILSLVNVDGLLVGGASLKAESFAKIVQA